jgi:hypothetical protein
MNYAIISTAYGQRGGLKITDRGLETEFMSALHKEYAEETIARHSAQKTNRKTKGRKKAGRKPSTKREGDEAPRSAGEKRPDPG